MPPHWHPPGHEVTKTLSSEACTECEGVCAVCQCEWEEGDEVRVLPCGHHFHTGCVGQWLGKHRACCPLCKADVGGGEQAAEDVHDSIWREGSPTFRFLRELCLSPTGEQQAGTDAGSAHYYHGAGAEGPTCPEGKQLPALLLPAHEVGGEKGAEDVHDSPTAQSPLFELPPGEQQAGTDAGSAHDHGAQGAEGPTCPEGEQPPALLHDSLWRERSPTAQSPLLELPPREQQAGTDAGSAHYHDAQEEALALRTQLEKRLDAANKQLAAAFAEAAGLKQELAALKLEYSKYKARAEARDGEQLAFVLNSLDSTLLYTCIVRSHNKSARAV